MRISNPIIGMDYNDVVYQDEDICILRPDSRRGIEIFTRSNSAAICDEGLFSYNELRRRHPELGLRRQTSPDAENHSDLIYFRPPFTSDTSSFERSYGQSLRQMIQPGNRQLFQEAIATIRVDPDQTYVYYQEARTFGRDAPFALEESRVLLSQHLDYINWYPTTVRQKGAMLSPRLWEVVAYIPHIPRRWLVRCVSNGLHGRKGIDPDFDIEVVEYDRSTGNFMGDWVWEDGFTNPTTNVSILSLGILGLILACTYVVKAKIR